MISLMQQAASVAAEHTTEHAAPAAAEHAAGMPQLDPSSYANQVFWLLVTLGVIYWALSRIALPRISAVLANRQGAMTGDLMAAEELKQKARDAEAAYEKALAEARAEAQKIVAANRAEIQAELDAAIAEADKRIGARAAESEARIGEIRASALDDARQVARDVTTELLASFGTEAKPAEIDAAVDDRLKGAA